MKSMTEERFLITQTAKQVEVEPHVLRYWEEELDLPIRRNELGHRYYTTEDIERFREIKKLKENGLQLKAIRTVLFDQKNDKLIPYEREQHEPTREEKAYRLQIYQ